MMGTLRIKLVNEQVHDKANKIIATSRGDSDQFEDQPILAKWNFPFLSVGPVHFHFKGGCVLSFISIQIQIEHSVSKQWRP